MDRGAWKENLLSWNTEYKIKAHYCKQNLDKTNEIWNIVFKEIIKI